MVKCSECVRVRKGCSHELYNISRFVFLCFQLERKMQGKNLILNLSLNLILEQFIFLIYFFIMKQNQENR